MRSATPAQVELAALAPLVLVARERLGHEGLARLRRPLVPDVAEPVGPAQPHAGLHPGLEGEHAQAVVAAEAHPEQADPVEVEVRAPGSVEHGGDRDVVVGADRQLVARLALAGTVHRQRGHAALEEDVLEPEELLLRRVEAGHEEHEGRPLAVRGWLQVPHDPAAVERHLDALGVRVEVLVGPRHRGHRPWPALRCDDPHELREVVAHGRPRLCRPAQAPLAARPPRRARRACRRFRTTRRATPPSSARPRWWPRSPCSPRRPARSAAPSGQRLPARARPAPAITSFRSSEVAQHHHGRVAAGHAR